MIQARELYTAFGLPPVDQNPHGFSLAQDMDLLLVEDEHGHGTLAHLLLPRHEHLSDTLPHLQTLTAPLDTFFSLTRSGRLCLSVVSPTPQEESAALLALVQKIHHHIP